MVKNLQAIAFALILLWATLFAVPVYDRLAFSLVASESIGNVAVVSFGSDGSQSTNCSNVTVIRNETLLKVSSTRENAFAVYHAANKSEFYYRAISNIGQHGQNITVRILYVKPTSARCYYANKMHWNEGGTIGAAMGYSPIPQVPDQVMLTHSATQQDRTLVQVNECLNNSSSCYGWNGRNQGSFKFEMLGSSNSRNLSFQAADGDNTDRIYYVERWGGQEARSGYFDAPFSSYRNSTFRSLSSSQVLFDIFLVNAGQGMRPQIHEKD
ncbi:Uncharacterised protein [Candidatus Anstonella stagnisolia]|nr:Uncharacterised protein [Candidatus Anstonella stagnisolia]